MARWGERGRPPLPGAGVGRTARVRVTGPVAPSLAWRRYDVPARWSRWAPQIRGVDYPHRRLRSGAAGTVRAALGLRVPFRIHEVDRRRRRWTWQVRALGLPMTMTHGVEPARGTGSAATLEISGPPGVVQGYALVARWALRRLVGT